MLVTTECFLPDYEVERLDIVYGVSVRYYSLDENIRNIRDFFSEEKKGYAKIIMNNIEQAIQMMIEKAQSLGANAIIAVKFNNNTEFSANMLEVLAYGTAVKLKPKAS